MIRNDTEYAEAIQRLKEEKKRLAQQKAQLQQLRLKPDEIKRALDPMRSFHLQLEEEVEHYEKLQRGEFGELLNFQGLGQLLIALRIYAGLSQRELAQRLSIHESQVSRDERNEYHNVTLERAGKILDALGVSLHTTVEITSNQAA